MVKSIICLLLCVAFQVKAQKPTLKDGLKAFLRSNTIYPLYARNHCIQGTVEVVFKLNKQGKVTYTSVAKGLGAGLDEEAQRLIKLTSGQWNMPVGYDTTALVRSPIKFTLEDFGCESATPATMGLALVRYNKQMESVKQVVGYYKNKEQGLKNMLSEDELANLITKLDLEESYFDRMIVIAQRKIAQGSVQNGCQDLKLVQYLGSSKANKLLLKYCK